MTIAIYYDKNLFVSFLSVWQLLYQLLKIVVQPCFGSLFQVRLTIIGWNFVFERVNLRKIKPSKNVKNALVDFKHKNYLWNRSLDSIYPEFKHMKMYKTYEGNCYTVWTFTQMGWTYPLWVTICDAIFNSHKRSKYNI